MMAKEQTTKVKATVSKKETQATAPKSDTNVENKVAAPTSALKGIAKSIAGLSYDERKQLNAAFNKQFQAESDLASQSKTYDGSAYESMISEA